MLPTFGAPRVTALSTHKKHCPCLGSLASVRYTLDFYATCRTNSEHSPPIFRVACNAMRACHTTYRLIDHVNVIKTN